MCPEITLKLIGERTISVADFKSLKLASSGIDLPTNRALSHLDLKRYPDGGGREMHPQSHQHVGTAYGFLALPLQRDVY